MARVFKIKGRDSKKLAHWYGKVKIASKRWQRVKLFTDKVASERRLAKLQQQADQRAAGMQTVETDRLAMPLKELVKQYIQSLRSRNIDADHIRITEWSLGQLLEAGKWQRFADITVPSVESILPTLAGTAGYQNTFIKKLKAFVHWALPDSWPDPLRKLKRVREKGAKKTRDRRAATVEEAAAFFAVWPQLPDDRHLCYALAMLNGLRRNEIKRNHADRLTWELLHLDAPIPFVDLKQKMGDGMDHVPLHPYVAKLLRERMEGMPSGAVVGAVPDMKTMKKDLTLAGIDLANAHGLRLDFHALRHSFQTALDRTGCSRATKKKLMRHANEDVTDGYAHAELAEMLAALIRLPSPQQDARAGTSSNTPVPIGANMPIDGVSDQSDNYVLFADHQLDQSSFPDGHSLALIGDEPKIGDATCEDGVSRYNARHCLDLHSLAFNGIENDCKSLIDNNLRPSTQVD